MRTITSLAIAITTALVCLWSVTALAAGVPVDQATEEQKTSAASAYEEAKEKFSEGKLEDALTGFRASYDIVASPNARFMIVACLSELGRHLDAYNEVLAAIPEARDAVTKDEKYQSTLTELESAKADLEKKIAFVSVTIPDSVDAAATLDIDGEEIPRERWGQPIPVSAGRHVVALTGHEPQEASPDAGGTATIEFATPEVAEPEPTKVVAKADTNWFMDHRRTLAYVAGGVGVAGIFVFAIFGTSALSAQNDLDDNCPEDPEGIKRCPPDQAGTIDDGRVFQAVANTSLIVGCVFLATGVGLFTWDILDPQDKKGDASAHVVVGAGHMAVQGRF